MKGRRLDVELCARGLCSSREKARRLILAGQVLRNGHMLDKADAPIQPDDVLALKEKPRFVGRGGFKLEGALHAFGIVPEGFVCFDAGASTGGFTDCLLQHGAARVYAYDVGVNQLVWSLRSDPRVICREKFNVRHMKREDVGEPVDLAVLDVSFISLTLILPPVMELIKDGGRIVCLIKPQFESRREDVGRGGIIREESVRQAAVEKIRTFVGEKDGWLWTGCSESPIQGADGNREFLACLTKGGV